MPNTSALHRVLALAVVALLNGCASRHPAEVVRRFHAAEANQAVAVDTDFFYAIDGAAIGKYDKRSGARVGGWNDSSGKITHLNSGVVVGGELYCAHSNYPETPMVSSLEVFETDRLSHIRSIPLPQGIGSATWVERGNDAWWVAFANYAGKGGEPGRGPETTKLVRFDREWHPQEEWTFPTAVVQRWNGMSSSGGVWVEGQGLYTTGHDARELYVLDLPASGHELTLEAIVPFESEGQGIAIDSSEGLLYSIQRRTREVIVSRLPATSTSHRGRRDRRNQDIRGTRSAASALQESRGMT
jgi:hypothetical protein